MYLCMNEETVFKSIGNLAQAIEHTSFEDWFRFVVMISKSVIARPVDKIIIGFND